MTFNKPLAAVLLTFFVALNIVGLASAGAAGLVELFEQGNAWAWVLGTDLLIALLVVLTWMWQDARSQSLSPMPYTVITLLTGSIGPLLYLLRRRNPERRAANRLSPAGRAEAT